MKNLERRTEVRFNSPQTEKVRRIHYTKTDSIPRREVRQVFYKLWEGSCVNRPLSHFDEPAQGTLMKHYKLGLSVLDRHEVHDFAPGVPLYRRLPQLTYELKFTDDKYKK